MYLLQLLSIAVTAVFFVLPAFYQAGYEGGRKHQQEIHHLLSGGKTFIDGRVEGYHLGFTRGLKQGRDEQQQIIDKYYQPKRDK